MVSAQDELHETQEEFKSIKARATCFGNQFRNETPVSADFFGTYWLKNAADTRVLRKTQNVSLYRFYCGRVGRHVVKRREAETPPA